VVCLLPVTSNWQTTLVVCARVAWDGGWLSTEAMVP